ncbi:hypothetical protein COL940_007632 [Colletotrichum noveboracense]|nr:hypothetical protein COL940_007632 [Colletotrichum noveboracense]
MSRMSNSAETQETISWFSDGKPLRVQGDNGLEPVNEAAMHRRINRKMDISLLPLLSILYLFNGLDRGNVGNAQTQGFTTDIGAVPDDLNLAVSLFFITFVVFQPPSAAIGRWLGAKYWIPIMMIGWGFTTLVQAFIKGRDALIATRLLIGAFEAGFYPTAVAYLSFFYCRYDLAVRVGLFYGQYAVAGAFSGAIAYGVFHLRDGILKNWQYLFIIEGTLTIFFGLIAWFFLPSGPGSAWFLTPDEQQFAAERMRQDNALFVEHTYSKNGIENERLKKRDFLEALRDWKFCKERGYHIVGGIVIALVGLIATVTVESHAGNGNNPEPGKRAIVLGANGFGNLAGVIGAQLYRDRYKPNYRLPFYVTLGFVAAALVGYLSYRFILVRVNRRKIEILRQKTSEDIERERVDSTRYADRKWTFIYGL